MARRVVLVIRTEFLRLVLRQLLRRQAATEIVAEADDLAGAQGLPDVGCLILERSLCEGEPAAVAALFRRHRGRIIVIGDGADVSPPAGIVSGTVIMVPAGSLGVKLDPSALGARLGEALTAPYPVRAILPQPETLPSPLAEGDSIVPRRLNRARRPALVGIAASTGGPETLQILLKALHEPVCPVIIALHIPKEHTVSLARHLAAVSGHPVLVGEAGPLPIQGIVLLQGGVDHAVAATENGLSLRLVRGGASNFHPNADILLSSMAVLNRPVTGVVLTGMGNDGCDGAKALAAQGYPVLAQRPSSCVVAGMPSAAIATGAVSETGIPIAIAERLNDWFMLPEN
jgi:two-component system chemotaxis response regulator CheB